jgi:acyl carrier protein
MSVELTKIQEIIASILKIEQEKVVETAHLVDDLGADSLERVELIMKIEEEFDITIPDSDSERITTVKAVLDYVNSKVN